MANSNLFPRHITPPQVQYLLQYTNSNNVLQVVDITKSFSGWTDFETDIVRDDITGAYIQVQENGIEFSGDSYNLIRNIYETQGFTASAQLLVNLRNDTFPNLWQYTNKIVLDLNFSEYVRERSVITLSANEDGLKEMVASNGGQKYDIPLGAMLKDTLIYDGLAIKETLSWFNGAVAGNTPSWFIATTIPEDADGQTCSFGFCPALGIEDQDVDANYNNYFTQYNQLFTIYSAGNNPSWQKWNGTGWDQTTIPILMTSSSLQKFNLSINGNLTIQIGGGQYANLKSLGSGTIYLIHDDTPNNYLGPNSIKVCDLPAQVNTGGAVTFNINATVSGTASANSNWYLYFQFEGVFASSAQVYASCLEFQFADNGFIAVEWVASPTNSISMAVVSEQNLLQALVNRMTNSIGAYLITYTYLDAGVTKAVTSAISMAAYTAQTQITYGNRPYLNSGTATPTLTVTNPNSSTSVIETLNSGVYSCSSSGLVIDSQSGVVNLASSLPGSYIIIYTFPITLTEADDSNTTTTYYDYTTATITIQTDLSTYIAYSSSPFSNSGNATPTIVGVQGGTFMASAAIMGITSGTFGTIPTGITINPNSGIINLAATSLYQYVALVDDHDETIRIAAGEAIRNFPTQFLHTSFTDFASYLKSCWGYEYEIVDNVIHFGLRDSFFVPSNAITLSKVNNLKWSVNKSYIYTGVKIGISLVNYSSINGTDEFRFTEEWSTGVQNVVNTLELISPFRTDAFGFQLLSEKQYDADTSNDISDSNIFAVHVSANSDGTYSVDRSNTITGVLSPSSMFNVIFSPRLCLIRNASLLGVSCSKLHFTSTEGFAGVILSFQANFSLLMFWIWMSGVLLIFQHSKMDLCSAHGMGISIRVTSKKYLIFGEKIKKRLGNCSYTALQRTLRQASLTVFSVLETLQAVIFQVMTLIISNFLRTSTGIWCNIG
jgi:hypothetical protein